MLFKIMELVLKIQWKHKKQPVELTEFASYPTKKINDIFAAAYKKRSKLDKVEIITAIMSSADAVDAIIGGDAEQSENDDYEEDFGDFPDDFTPSSSHKQRNVLQKSHGSSVKFHHYYFDSKTEAINEDCLVNIRVKAPPKKQLTFEEKVGYLTAFMKKNSKEPEPGNKYKDFDVGKFYVTSNIQADKAKEVNDVVAKYIK